VLCVRCTSIINSPKAISIQVETLRTLNIICPTDNSSEEITSSRLLKKISLVPKILRKYSIERIASPFVALKKVNIEEDERTKEEIKSKSRERNCKQPQYFRSTRLEISEKENSKNIYS